MGSVRLRFVKRVMFLNVSLIDNNDESILSSNWFDYFDEMGDDSFGDEKRSEIG